MNIAQFKSKWGEEGYILVFQEVLNRLSENEKNEKLKQVILEMRQDLQDVLS